MAERKTNVMRILDKEKIPYQHLIYKSDGQIDGVHVATMLNIPFEQCFKTLVTYHKEHSRKTENFIFCIPVDKELNLKAAAKSVGVKNVEMLAVKDLMKTTGYVRGGCSPVGMKKTFITVIDKSALEQDTVSVSGGKIGAQIRLEPNDLAKLLDASFDDIIF